MCASSGMSMLFCALAHWCLLTRLLLCCCLPGALLAELLSWLAGKPVTAAQVNDCFEPGLKDWTVDYGKLAKLGELKGGPGLRAAAQ